MRRGPERLCFVFIFLLFSGWICPAQNIRNQGSIDAEYRRQAVSLAASLEINTLAAQVLLTAVDGRDAVSQKTRELLAKVPAGGIMLFSHNMGVDPEKTGIFIAELFRCITAVSLPPFMAADQEGGSVQRFRGKAALPPPLSYWEKLPENNRGVSPHNTRSNTRNSGSPLPAAMEAAFDAIEKDAAGAGRELRRIGITLNLAPVTEVLTTENQPFLKNRSYSPDPVFVSRAAAAFVRGMQSAGVASTLKHFPGNSAADPHRSRSVLTLSGAELEKLLEPFNELIRREDPAVVMLSHVIVPSWDTKPSSLSLRAVRRLRGMGFTGIIMADDFSMAAAGSPVEICAVEALAAGVDMIMAWPGDLLKIHQAILTALDTGKLSERRLREAAERIIYQKIRYGLIR
ncbi:MAG: glycoside hydrolase family 3 protein [Treponema sp.]|jgi:beta-N-acetylhexosaminidase|nr:glycoside hydrolase family 3 protein [Treponema sp.]